MTHKFNTENFGIPTGLAKQFIGFEQMIDRIREASEAMPKVPTYPPYNVRKTDDNKYVIEIAVAGFGKQDLEIEMQEGVLTVRGQSNAEGGSEDYLFKGIADRAFTRKFTIADHVEVKNADLINGLLKIWLERFIPEEKKPKKINIGDAPSDKQLLTEKK